MTRVSIRDVAAETGYSPATVSNVLNEKGNVGAKATNIILKAIARLGYSRSTQISRIIFAIARVNGRIVDESTFQTGVYTGIERAARRLGLPSAMVTLSLWEPLDPPLSEASSFDTQPASKKAAAAAEDSNLRIVIPYLV